MGKIKFFGRHVKNTGNLKGAMDGKKTGSIIIRENENPKARLEYYRAHGLTNCDDYPGGDAAFEHDVLSGQYRDRRFCEAPLKREDYYVLKYMLDGKFNPELDFFLEFSVRACIINIFCFKNGIDILVSLLPGQENPYIADMKYCDFDLREYYSQNPFFTEDLKEKRNWKDWKHNIKKYWKDLTHWKI